MWYTRVSEAFRLLCHEDMGQRSAWGYEHTQLSLQFLQTDFHNIWKSAAQYCTFLWVFIYLMEPKPCLRLSPAESLTPLARSGGVYQKRAYQDF